MNGYVESQNLALPGYESGSTNINWLLKLMADMGIDLGMTPGLEREYDPLQALSEITSQDISTGLRGSLGIGQAVDMPAHMFPAIDPNLIQALGQEFYKPELEYGQYSAEKSYLESMRKASQVNRGFDKTKRRDDYRQGIKDIYEREIATQDIGVKEKQLAARDKMAEQFTKWQQAAQQLRFA